MANFATNSKRIKSLSSLFLGLYSEYKLYLMGMYSNGKNFKYYKKNLLMTFKLLWQFKWYICPYLLFYVILLMFYISPSPKQYNIWMNKEWFTYNRQTYVALTELMLIIFALLFLVGTSNMRNHPLLAKLIFLSSLFFGAVFLEII